MAINFNPTSQYKSYEDYAKATGTVFQPYPLGQQGTTTPTTTPTTTSPASASPLTGADYYRNLAKYGTPIEQKAAQNWLSRNTFTSPSPTYGAGGSVSGGTSTTGGTTMGGTVVTGDGLIVPGGTSGLPYSNFTGGNFGSGLTPQEEADAKAARDMWNVDTPNEEDIYNKRLRLYQDQINSINMIYSDLINRAQSAGEIRKKGALGGNRALQARSGLLGSSMGLAQTSNVATSQDEITGAEVAKIANEQNWKISQLLGLARQDASKEYADKLEAKRKGGEALLDYYEKLPEKRRASLSAWAQALISQGIDPTTMSEDDINEIAKNYSLGYDDVVNAINTAKSSSATSKLESEKAQLGVEKLRKEVAEIGKMTPYQAAQIGISQAHLQIAKDRAAKESSSKYKNYDEGTIPTEVKSEILFDLSQNRNAKRKEQITIQDLFDAYPEVETSYLLDLWAQELSSQG